MIIGIPKPNRFYAPWEFVESLLLVAGLSFITESGPIVSNNRNVLMMGAVNNNANFILMIDTDMVFSPNAVEVITGHMKNGLDIVSGFCRHNSLESYTVYQKHNNKYESLKEIPSKTEIIEVDAVGAGFLAINKQVIDKM